MSLAGPVAAALLLGAATVVAWPATTARARRRAVLARHSPDRRTTPGRATGVTRTFSGIAAGGRLGLTRIRIPAAARYLTAGASVVGGITGVVVGGPVAGLIGAVYAGLAAHLALRRRAARLAAHGRRHRLDRVGALAADLRAGLPLPPITVDEPTDRIDQLVQAAARLADRTGAPLADLLDRIEADARAMDRGLAAAAAQAAGAQATAWLLALLPLGGIALGFAIGVDPVEVLLHTPIGAACVVSALLLQLGGLAWADRLNATATRAR